MILESVTPDGLVAELTGIGEGFAGETIASGRDAIDLVGNASYQGFEAVLLNADRLAPEFFDLSSGLAGEVLQKFSNYGMQLGIIGDFEGSASESLRAFIRESNRNGQTVFARSQTEALGLLRRG
ncbi:MAG: DUF4180 domain-containing protein [Trueperaceae bacterium]|nr:DUF4180 domain-containing protein [Trueperaceae bacterium]